MAVTQVAEGPTTTDGTEQVLATETVAGVYQLRIDTRNMAKGDRIELRVYLSIDTAESRYLAEPGVMSYSNKQGDGTADAAGDGAVVKFSLPYTVGDVGNGVRFSLKRVAGTDRAYEWSVVKHA